MEETKDKIIEFLSKFIGDYELEDDENLFSSGLINSLFALQLIMFIEKEFGIKVDNKSLNLKNFDTLDAIISFIQSR